jgi:hypothetical protein
MRFRCLVVALTFLAAFASDSWGQSKQPPSHSNPPSKQNTQTAAPDQRGTDQMPLTVKILPGEKTHAETAKEKYESDEKPSIDRALSTYTGWLAVFTATLFFAAAIQVGLFYWQLRLIKDAAKDTAATADAAKLNAQGVIDAERARLFIVIDDERAFSIIASVADTWDLPEDDARKLGLPPIKYRLKNYGKTPAFIHEIMQSTVVSSELPREREYTALVPLPVDHVLGAGETTVPIPEILESITFEQVAAIRNLSTTFWFYGSVTYEDAFRVRYTLDFVWHFSGVSNGFRTFSYRETKHADEK